jgi:enoyl-CoA hydratase/carnithine racemase
MTDPYARYTRLKFDRPHPKVIGITMENGRMNTTDAAMHAELGDIWRDVDRDVSVNAAILTGAGKVFSAGGDFAIIEENIADFTKIVVTIAISRKRLRVRHLRELRKALRPTVRGFRGESLVPRRLAAGASRIRTRGPT